MHPERVHVAIVIGRDPLPEPGRPLAAVQAEERYLVAGHLHHQMLKQGQRQPVSWVVGAVVADDAQQGPQILLAQHDRNRHRGPLPRTTPRL